jgi:hypothetical protein
MNFTAQIKRGVTALVLFSALGAFALAHAANVEPQSARPAANEVAPTRIAVVAKPASNASTTTRVHVGRPILVSANPTKREIERASR